MNSDLWHLQMSQTAELTTLESKTAQPSHSLPVCRRTGLAFSAQLGPKCAVEGCVETWEQLKRHVSVPKIG